ncbi:2-oxoglutarate dehydrogenase E1 component [Simkania negevensis]|uniref:oxoglutarate dehydrogenase (succinyl-transferring) n=1 Tax=Simkania negevensis TaxID=83561 RepID=A0ABS3ARY3_9BACT|nr:2-oxoglutarate dehydrogenase E1 component [Simkania negevensis]
MPGESYSFASMANISLIEEMYDKFRADSSSVDDSWCRFFEGVEFASKISEGQSLSSTSNDLRISTLINAYRSYGHLLARFDPIDPAPRASVPELDLATLGFEEDELNETFPTCGLLDEKFAPLSKIIEVLREIYCNKVGFEFVGLQNVEMEEWIEERVEAVRCSPLLSMEQKKAILQHLNKSELLELFLHTKYVGQKRFSLEGAETLIPIIAEVIELGSVSGLKEFVIGMAHRGRLNVLANILNKSYSTIFHEFEENYLPGLSEGSGDVKYHKGFSADIITRGGRQVHVSLTANPSHLEAVNAVVEGQVKAKQVLKGDVNQEEILPLLIHGDSAISGQGTIYECLQLCNLPGYSAGGTIHIVINNQIGFTTTPKESRSTRYCTDIARTFGAPVFHVNGEDPEMCIFVTDLAVQLRQKFHCDVFIDLNCYRKYGHNEGDEPFFTQPLEYKLIRQKASVRQIYRDSLVQHGVLEKHIAHQLEEEFNGSLKTDHEGSKLFETAPPADLFKGPVWKEFVRTSEKEINRPFKTQVPQKTLKALAKSFCAAPEGFNIHKKIARLNEDRFKMVGGSAKKKTIDWGMAEMLAFASLLAQGKHIRLSGQDSRRGTFSHRHAMWVDQDSGKHYFPLSHLKPGQGRCHVYNSILSEFAVLAFEFGYSLSYPDALVIWEAQFGDFCNGAQVVIDQFIAVTEQKWNRYSGLTLLLPHGYEGQGPEHSSARIERFLQLSGEDNWYVVNPTTPAQFFHLLRKQVLQQTRRPLIVFTPKGLLRYQACKSSLEELSKGAFEKIIDDPTRPKKAKRILLCSGRIYYDLIEERERRKKKDIVIVRIEQLYPLKKDLLKKIINQYKGYKEMFWVQDEPSNMGAWLYIYRQMRDVIPVKTKLQYAGRKRSASTAVGNHAVHKQQHTDIMQQAFE